MVAIGAEYTVNSLGASIDPCGTPRSDVAPFTETSCLLFSRYDVIHYDYNTDLWYGLK